MDYKDFIEAKPDIMLGKPVIMGTRLSVEFILKKLSEGATIEDLKAGYTVLSTEVVLAAIAYESDVISNETY